MFNVNINYLDSKKHLRVGRVLKYLNVVVDIIRNIDFFHVVVLSHLVCEPQSKARVRPLWCEWLVFRLDFFFDLSFRRIRGSAVYFNVIVCDQP